MNFQELKTAIETERANRNLLISKHPENENIIALHYSESCVFNSRWNEWNMQFRDMVIDLEKEKILARPVSKFFNHWTRKNMGLEIPSGTPEITDKLDGVRVTAFSHDEKTEFVSHGEFNTPATSFAKTLWEKHFSNVTIPQHLTLTFEIMDESLRVILPQKFTRFVLVAARDNVTGEDYTLTQLKTLQAKLNENAGNLSIETLQPVDITVEEAIEATDKLPWNIEGYVIRIGDTRIKVKSRAYLRAFKTMYLMSKKQKLQIWSEGKFDELIHKTPEDFHVELLKLKEEFEIMKIEKENEIENQFKKAVKKDRKTFALWVKDNAVNNLKLLFDKLDGRLSEQTIRQFIYQENKKNI